MKGWLSFNIETEYIRTGFEALKRYGEYKYSNKKNIWAFPLVYINDVEAILGEPIEFSGGEVIKTIINRSPSKREYIEVSEFKGKGEIVVLDSGLIYNITEYRKIETEDGEIINQEIHHELPKENVNIMRKVLKEIDETKFKNNKISCGILADNILKKLNINRFHRETGTFDWAKFFGNRKEYYKYYYLPLKVLVYYNEVIHHKNGKITKLKTLFDFGKKEKV